MTLQTINEINFESSLNVLYKVNENELPFSKSECFEIAKNAISDPPFNLKSYIFDSSNYFVYPDWIPRNEESSKSFQKSVDQFFPGSDISRFINDVEDDPHTKKHLLDLKNIIKSVGFDPSIALTTTAFTPKHLICFGTGSGHALNEIITTIQPNQITVIVTKWEQFISSWFQINWGELWNEYCLDDTKLIGFIKTSDSRLVNSALGATSLTLDHSIFYKSNASDEDLNHLISKTQSGDIVRSLYYLGFTMDEYNMMYNSWRSLQSQPKMYTTPSKKTVHGTVVVCGSGPSLDDSIDDIKFLQDKALIVACASNYGTLRKAGINVDVLCLLERGDFMIDQYRETYEAFGGDTYLFASVTTPVELHKYFKSTMTYFRPALTPLSLFAENTDQILNHEGPQTINTGVALAKVLCAKHIILCGVDLGTSKLDNVRSKHAIGESPRDFPIQVEGNYGGNVYTNETLQDGALVLENMSIDVFEPGVELYNKSDGVKIKGWTPLDRNMFNQLKYNFQQFDKKSFSDWWVQSRNYDVTTFNTMWKIAKPRQVIFNQCQKFKSIINSEEWYPSLLFKMQKALSIQEGTKYEQIASRLIRNGLIKSMICAQRQRIVMASDPEKCIALEAEVRDMLCSLVDDYFEEIISLFDVLESISTDDAFSK